MIRGRKGREGMKIMAYFHIYFGQDAAGAAPVIRKIEIKDIREALEEGLTIFGRCPRMPPFSDWSIRSAEWSWHMRLHIRTPCSCSFH